MADKITTIRNLSISQYDDGSTYIETGTCGAALNEGEDTAVARILSPLYVVKSAAGCYATFAAACCESCESTYDGPSAFVWTEERATAAHFVSKEAARAVAKNCYPTAGARVVRVKR